LPETLIDRVSSNEIRKIVSFRREIVGFGKIYLNHWNSRIILAKNTIKLKTTLFRL